METAPTCGEQAKITDELRRVRQQIVAFLDFDRHERLVEIIFAAAVPKDGIAAPRDRDARVNCFGIDLVPADEAKQLDGRAVMKKLRSIKKDKIHHGAGECFA